ncbi:MAG TPA: tetratricopeptide repeat protein, partial [Verrucomicrobiae bacterium]|nr:tetratricopeptide repeat protein [Verrucomicrobiae bacterium]
ELWKVFGSTLLLLILTGICLAMVRRAPYLIVGWLWYMGTLFPTVGLISVGLQSIADRYTYIPFIGLFIMIACSAAKLPGRVAISALSLAACSIVSWHQVQHWRNTETLFAQCVRATRNNAEGAYNLALAEYLNGKRDAAIHHFEEAVRIRPQYQDARNNLGLLLLEAGDAGGATNVFTGLLRLNPTHEVALLNMGRALAQLGDESQAKGYFELARSAEARVELGRLLEKMGRTNEAQIQFREAERVKPGITRQPSPAALARP